MGPDPDFPGCKFFDDPDQDAPAPDAPWTFNPTVPQPPDLNLHPDQIPGVGPSPGNGNPFLQPLPPPIGPAPDLPDPPSLFPDDGRVPLPGLGPFHPFLNPWDDPDPFAPPGIFDGPSDD